MAEQNALNSNATAETELVTPGRPGVPIVGDDLNLRSEERTKLDKTGFNTESRSDKRGPAGQSTDVAQKVEKTAKEPTRRARSTRT